MSDDLQPGTPEHAAQIAALVLKLAGVVPKLLDNHRMLMEQNAALSAVTMALVRELQSVTGTGAEALAEEAKKTLRSIGLNTAAVDAAVGRLVGEDGTIDWLDASGAFGLQ